MQFSGKETKEREIDNIRFNLRNLVPFLEDPQITDIFCSAEGEVSVKRFGQAVCDTGFLLTMSDRLQLLNQIAKYMEQNIDFFRYPVLEATIPVPEWKNARITGIFPPWVSGPSFTVRRPPEKIYLLENYVENGQLSRERYETITGYIKDKKNIIIAGGTGSGKTTLTNALIQKKCEFFPNDRYFIVQDVSELQCNAKYAEMIIIRSDQAISAVTLSLRYTPNCIIFGEVRKGPVMAELLDAWNTGHPGGLTTIHSNSAALTSVRIKKLLPDHYPGESSLPDLNEYIDLIIYTRQDKNAGVVIDELMEMKKLQTDAK
ncbi:MAG: Flp pilus assembly complex ATPase component TadA [Treponema sp.]|jgi:type IV secretion system protein VirB11|nr:Flp pilus assembly complex ATPase component TadA [Treponema sp.]